MPIFRIISLSTGVVLTAAAVYAAQKETKQQCHQDNASTGATLGARIAVSFLTSVIVGGSVNKIVNTVFK